MDDSLLIAVMIAAVPNAAKALKDTSHLVQKKPNQDEEPK